MDLRKLKDKATEAFAKGRFAKAAELYADYCKQDPKDLQARLRMGDAYAKSGDTPKAVRAYQSAAEGYAREGFLPRAIAASKLILELDPSHTGVQQMLADLYARKTSDPKGAKKPSPLQPARREIELPPEPAAAPSTGREIELPPDPQAEAAAPTPGPADAGAPLDLSSELPPELQLPQSGGTEVEVELDLSGRAPDAGAAAPAGQELELLPPEVEVSQEQVLELARAAAKPPSPAADPPEEVTEVIEPDAEETVIVQPQAAAPVPVPGPDDPEPAEELVVASAPSRPRIVQTLSEEEARAALARAQASGLPPGLRPKKGQDPGQEEIILLDRPKTPVPPAQDARIWIPPSFTPLPGASPLPTAPAARVSSAGEDAPRAGRTDLEAGMAAFSRFDELELDVDSAAAALPPPPRPRAPPAPARPMPSFTELELEGESLLHAVETAARAGMGDASAPQASAEEAFSIGDELVDGPAGAEPGALPKIPLFSDLTPEAFIELFERCPLRRFSAKERVIEQGSLGDSFFVICGGKVNVFRTEDGGRKDLATLEEGAFFGEMALLSGAPRTASVEADSEETQLLEISAQILAQLSHRYPPVAQALKKFCRQRMLANVMAASAFFRPFDKKDRRTLVERFRARDVAKGGVVIREGAASDGLYVVLSGEVEVNKGETVLARLKEGDVFGEMSLLSKSPASATVSATKRTSLLRLPRADFDQIISSHPQILAMIAELTDDRRKQNEAVLAGAAQMGEEGLLLV